MSTQLTPTRTVVTPLVAGGLLTLVCGVAVQALVIPLTDVSDDRFSYPWSPAALLWVSLLYAVFHVLIAYGLWAVRDRAGTRAGRGGLTLAAGATLLLFAGEIASIPLRDRPLDDATVGLATGLLFGLGTLVSALAMLVAGIAEVRARRSPFSIAVLASGLVTAALLALILTPVMALAIGIYGASIAVVGFTARNT
ncbi:hypothetical protein [Kribbella catacumbae]|uniref:hypothetical protein n=1 Tax=Kribbella catacumbae TaxID=460086 RepID=UPI000382667F|nr:hypothetical protein [Kribbella catacumbae]